MVRERVSTCTRHRKGNIHDFDLLYWFDGLPDTVFSTCRWTFRVEQVVVVVVVIYIIHGTGMVRERVSTCTRHTVNRDVHNSIRSQPA